MAKKSPNAESVEELQRQIAALQSQLATLSQSAESRQPPESDGAETGPARDTIIGDNVSGDKIEQLFDTGGGAAFAGAVQAGGHVIGRDFIQYITQVVRSGEDAEEARSVVAAYLHALAGDLAGLKLGEIDASAISPDIRREPLQLADVYVPLDTTLQIPKDMSLVERLEADGGSARFQMEGQRESRPVSALEALAAHAELTLLGKPGSGKSTFGASVLLALANAWRGDAAALASLGESWTYGALLPIRVVLRRFAEHHAADGKPLRAGDLWAFVGRDLEQSGFGLSGKTMDIVQRIARRSGALILLDGLDECGSVGNRERVLNAVSELIRNAGGKCRFLVTARPYAWPEGPDPHRGVYALADFNDEQIALFIETWYAALVTRKWSMPGEAERKRDDLLAARQRRELRPLAENPLLLTLMATLHSNKGRLPDDRADLYNDSVDLLMLRWNRQIGADRALLDELDIPGLKLSDLREVLEEVAFRVHGENVDREGTADIGEDRLVRAFRPLLGNSKDKADIVVDFIEKRAGLLLGKGDKDGERQFEFPHRTFQEFLAACHLAASEDFAARCATLAREAPAHWSVVLPLAARLAKAERGVSAADELIGGVSITEFRKKIEPDTADWTNALLAGMQLQELGPGAIAKSERMRAVASRVRRWLVDSLPVHPDGGGMRARLRAQAGEVLAALGDPRFDPDRFHLPNEYDLGFVHVPADPDFRIGTPTKRFESIMRALDVPAEWRDLMRAEINHEVTPSPEFHISRYPVTVAQFRAFATATGYEPSEPAALRDSDNRPVRYVDWYEALAYCDWLNEQFGTAEALVDSDVARRVTSGEWRVTLPTELEWEKAARGGSVGLVFPWGDDWDSDRANCEATALGDTSSVGCFPPNGYGVFDMAGNAWEWTRSLWGTNWQKADFIYPYRSEDRAREDPNANREVARVVRGGSWGDDRSGARCAYRCGLPPDYRNVNVGFRVVLRSSPDS